MKQFAARFSLFCSFSLIVCAIVGCKTSETEHSHVCTVVSVGGEARYWDGQNNKVHVIKNGDQIPSGSTIETAKGMGNYIDLAMGKRLSTIYWNYPYVFDPGDSLRVNEDSVLKLEKVILRTVGGNRTLDARLHLLQGSVLIRKIGTQQEAFLQAGAAAPSKGTSNWELRGSNCVVRAEGGGVWFSALGLTRVIWGTATVERIDEKTTTHLTDGQQYDVASGNISVMDERIRMVFILGPDFAPPAKTQRPRFPIPQRPF
jgi:hypothetical protein